MATESSISFSNSGDLTVQAAETVLVPSALEIKVALAEGSGSHGIELITEMISDPDSALPDIMRLIALEMAKLMKKMTIDDPLSRGAVSQRDLNDQVKAFAQLQKTLTDSDSLSRKDTLNLDGPKFKFVFVELVRYFQDSLKGAGVEPAQTQNIMLQFGDTVRANYESMQRELNKIESGR
jgi:hypothetical protein